LEFGFGQPFQRGVLKEVYFMPSSVFGSEVQAIFDSVRMRQVRRVSVGGETRTIRIPFPSPEDWRDHWIYFLMVDRFNNPNTLPLSTLQTPPVRFDEPFAAFQGGNFEGVLQQLDYIRQLGASAIWLTPVLKNCQYENGTFHGYGIQDFLHAEPRFASDPATARANPDGADDELRALVDAIHARGMYVIFDIVLNHTGNVFGYVRDGLDNAADAPFQDSAYLINWHDEQGRPTFHDFSQAPNPLSRDAAVWPLDLQHNELFRRQGKESADVPRAKGDFESLKQMVSESPDLDRVLIRAYQYVIARFDCDGFRIDTFKLPDPAFGHTFCAAMREFALSIGKENFFTFGEITTGEDGLTQFIGRDTKAENNDTIGIDAALDFALEGTLNRVVKHPDPSQPGPPTQLVGMYQARKNAERTIITTHGDASGFFVTFLDNHDRHQRFYFQDPANNHRWDNQLLLAVGVLFGLQGIPAVYYGTEQGFHGIGGSDANVREALWGKFQAFDQAHPFYRAIQGISAVRTSEPALRYGRQYFRQLSGNGKDFSVSPFTPGVIAFSRILDAAEVLVVANTSDQSAFQGEAIVDADLNKADGSFRVLFSNFGNAVVPGALRTAPGGSVSIRELDGTMTSGPARVLPVTVGPLEVQILRR
jgi:glycosidase